MYLIVTRAYPPELGGMQSLMWGLTKEMSKNFMIKVFADYQENHKEFDKNENFYAYCGHKSTNTRATKVHQTV